MKQKYLLVSILMLITMFFLQISCQKNDIQNDNTWNNYPLPKLSNYGFFKGNMADMNPSENVIPYDLNTPLFSNYAQKARFVYLPNNEKITYNPENTFDFPAGAILIKTFYYPFDFNNPEQGKKIIETRLIIKTDQIDKPYITASYWWNEEQTEAEFKQIAKAIQVSWKHYDGTNRNELYVIPSQNDCIGCHSYDNKVIPIGTKARNLNKNFTYPDGTSSNQIDKWTSLNILSQAPPANQAPKAAQENDSINFTLDQRARSYIDINCAHCHNQHGPANNSGLWLQYSNTDSTQLGICKSPVAAGTASGGLPFAVYPGKPEKSIMLYRLNSIEPEVAMPELARSVIHTEGVSLIRQWIASLKSTCN